MSQVFISYSRADEQFAREITDDLQERGVEVWIDVHNIGPTEHWGKAVQHGLELCRVLIIILSPEAMESRHVEDEWTFFRDLNKPILPILYRPTRVTFGLHNLQYIDFDKQDYDSAFRQLQLALRKQGITLPVKVDTGILHPPLDSPPLELIEERGVALRSKPPVVLHLRTGYISAANMIDTVKHDLWVSGVSLTNTCRHVEQLRHLLDRKGKIRLMMIDPNDERTIADTAAYVGTDTDALKERLKKSLGILCPLCETYHHQVQLKTLIYRPSVGYFISDPHGDEGVMTVASYFYDIDRIKGGPEETNLSCEPPLLRLSNQIEQQWFMLYRQDFERLWDAATAWTFKGNGAV